jgi:predicted DNA-binding transcriptional regulator YafY
LGTVKMIRIRTTMTSRVVSIKTKSRLRQTIRLVEYIAILQRGKWTYNDLAAKFNTSHKTARRYIEAISLVLPVVEDEVESDTGRLNKRFWLDPSGLGPALRLRHKRTN